VAWAKLKEYHRKAITADSNLKTTYPDAALFLILSSSLPSSFKPLTSAFIAQPMSSIEEKFDILVGYKMDMQDEEIKAEQAHIAKSSIRTLKDIDVPSLTQTKAAG
jgi:hypothetical protein